MIATIANEFRLYKSLGEAAIGHLRDADLSRSSGEDNSIAVIVWHVGGNLRSRFTDFRTSDGEKPWRNRDEEFVQRTVTSQELMAKWNSGWDALFEALAPLTDADFEQTITIRSQPMSIGDALLRALAHISYHVGQIVYVAKSIRGAEWQTLSIPKGASQAYNQNPGRETAEQHAAMLDRRTVR